MADQKPQAKIPVKKSDGTTVFLTMDEFREYKKKSVAPAAPVVAPVPTPTPEPAPAPKKLEQGKVEKIVMPEPLPIVADTHTELATTTPVTDIFFDEAKSKESLAKPQPPVVSDPVSQPEPEPSKPQWKESDHASLLEADVTQEKKLPDAPIQSGDNAASILATVKEQFPLPISKDIEGRFDSLVLSRIRDVRSVLDFEQYAKKTKADGGLGLEEDQVGLLLAVIAAAQKIAGSSSSSPKPQPKTSAAPVDSAPANSSIRITPVMSPPVQKPVSPFPLPKEEYSFVPPVSTAKPMMQDVVVNTPRKQTVGPVDEIQYFSLVDFRRLSPKTESAKEILKGKFQALQEESYILFLDARDAWHESPLFVMYEQTVLGALQNKKTLSDAVQEKQDGLTQVEFDALVEINHSLG